MGLVLLKVGAVNCLTDSIDSTEQIGRSCSSSLLCSSFKYLHVGNYICIAGSFILAAVRLANTL